MSTPSATTAIVPCAVRISPAGHLLFDRDVEGDASFHLSDVAATRLADAFESGAAHALLRLASGGIAQEVGPALGHWRELAKLFLTRLCQHLDPEEALKNPGSLALPATELARFIEQAPPMPGGEYLNAVTLEAAWRGLREAFLVEAHASGKPLEAYLRGLSPLWSAVGRVFFHLAENKARPDLPFAFLATYTSRVSQQGKLQHIPLGKAVKESAEAADKASLLALLAPLKRAADASELLRGLVDSGGVFQTLAWTPAQAHRFLREVPLYEEHGIFVRVPNWWSPRNPPRVTIDVRIGEQAGAGLGTNALLDFSVNAAIEGDPLTVKEWRELANQNEGLVLVKGRWIEVDREKLDQLLKHWKRVEKDVKAGGVSFLDGMRMIAGFSTGSIPVEGSTQDLAKGWLSVHAGTWLKDVIEELQGHVKELIEFSPEELRASLRPYQAEGVQWLALLHKLRLGGCLADDMGLGKTLQVLALLVHLKRQRSRFKTGRASLLVIPASLLGNWRSECERFAPELKLAVVHPSEPDQTLAERAEGLAGIDLVVTTYSMLTRLEWLRASEWEVVVLDEAQAIKNPSTRQTRAVKDLKSYLRIALTGTPIENRLGDLWSLFDFLQPGLLGGPTEFSRLARTTEDSGEVLGKLRTLVRPYLLRRLKSDKRIIADLPDKQEIKAYCGLKKPQAVLYQQAVDELKQSLKSAEGIRRRGIILTFLMRFKQICNHPSQWTGDGSFDAAASGKMARLLEICEEIAARQEKVLVFTQFRELTLPLEALLQKVFGRQGLVLDGSTAVGKRKGIVEAFQSENGPAHFVLSLKAGGTGLNLTAASHVIHFDRWWNPAVENQATDRAYRIGQKRSVLVHKFVCRGTIEERIDTMLEQKQGLADEILKDGAEKRLTEMTNDELMAIVTLDRNRAVEAI